MSKGNLLKSTIPLKSGGRATYINTNPKYPIIIHHFLGRMSVGGKIHVDWNLVWPSTLINFTVLALVAFNNCTILVWPRILIQICRRKRPH